MKKQFTILAIIAVVLLAGCDKLKGTAQPTTTDKETSPSPVTEEETVQQIPVGTEKVKTGPITLYHAFSGDVYPVSTMAILPETSGKIVEVLASEGDRVQKDQVLARLDQSRPGMNYNPSDVKAPMSGTLLSFSAQIGGMAAPSSSLGTIITDKDVEIRFNVVERYLSLVKEGQQAVFVFDAYPDEQFHGSITRLSPVVDGQSRTRKVYCKLDKADERIIPGMYVRIQLVEKHSDQAILIPTSAIVRHEAERVVYVAENDVARMVAVKTGIEADGMSEIVSGLDRDAVVITQGQAALQDGSPITVTNEGKGTGR